ncbi:energy transducer TonB [Pseudaquabacterium terrae]|uniref:energy transducer TonB n=1 Tax=Pseudaquabacterium terrae TaxID=2732868 RepID=UPI001FE6D70E|nr:energy transducer TonB [Aquabacterium terrae]
MPLHVRAAPLPLARHRGESSRAERRWLVAGVAGVHLLALWGLLQVEAVREAVRELSPLIVEFVAVEAPPKPAPPPPPRQPIPLPRVVPPAVIAPAPSPTPAPTPFVVPAPEPAPAPVIIAAEAPPAPHAPPPAPAPTPKRLPPSAVRYRVQPPIEVPMASRRLGESGTVLLRVLVGTDGRPRQITLHKSSGFARLDEQALQAMRRALFEPYTENGVALEGEVTAPLEYVIE